MSADRRRIVSPGELLSIRADAIQEDRGAFFWMFGPSIASNERIGSAAVVQVRGALDYHDDGYGESYESIVCRVRDALSGEDVIAKDRIAHRWEDDYESTDPVPPSCVVLKIDSPGGVVAGLDQTVRKLRAMSKDAGVPLYAYVDETAYSAGFALACACEKIVIPRAGFVGSIGVISTLVDQTAANDKAGIKVVLLTSGTKKAYGNPHSPISDAVIDEERPRVMTLAKQFFAVVKTARGIDIDTIQGWEAKRFLGAEAKRAGLVDDILSWDEFISAIGSTDEKSWAKAGQSVPSSTVPKGLNMNLSIEALIARTEKSMKGEKDPVKLAALAAEAEAYKKTKHSIEKHETEEGENEEAEAEPEDSEEEDPEEDEDDEDEDEDEKKKDESKKAFVSQVVSAAGISEKSARVKFRQLVASALAQLDTSDPIAAMARKVTGKRSPAAVVSALEGMAAGIADVKSRLVAVEKQNRTATKTAIIATALSARRISPAKARELGGKKLAFVEEFLSMHKSPIVNSDEDPLAQAQVGAGSGGGTLPTAVQVQLDRMVEAAAAHGVKLDPKDLAVEYNKNASNGAVNGRVL